MITIKPLNRTFSGYKILKFYMDGKEMGSGDTLNIKDIEPTEYLKIMVNENGNIDVWTEDIEGNETKINWGRTK